MVKLVGIDSNKAIKETERLLVNKKHYKKMASVLNAYGDGMAVQRIVAALLALDKGHP